MANKYTFQKEGSNVAVFENGSRIATGTPEYAKTQYGYDDTVNAPISSYDQSKPQTPVTTPITSPVSAPVNTQSPTFPEPQAPAIQTDYITSAAETAAKTRAAVESEYQKKSDEVGKRIEESQKKFDELTGMEESIIDTNIQPLLTPFREELENSERERLYINENFEANQKLVNELDSLLTEGNAIVRGERSRFASRSSIAAGVSKTMTDINARVGVIQAVIAARNGQIGQAQTLIDRSVAAINADRQDQLTYYKTILDFYDKQRDEEGAKILNLDKEQKEYAEKQVNLIEGDMKKAEEYAENIKQAMTDPDTAQLYADAGVKLTDSPEVIAKKIGDATYTKEVRDKSNEMAKSGYTYLAPGASAPAGTETVTITDSRGREKRYYKAKSASSSDIITITPENTRDLAGAGFSPSDIIDIKASVNDFGIEATLKAIDDPAKRAAVAKVYNATAVLDAVETELEPVEEKQWWEFWK